MDFLRGGTQVRILIANERILSENEMIDNFISKKVLMAAFALMG